MSPVRIASVVLVGLALTTLGAVKPQDIEKARKVESQTLEELALRNQSLEQQNQILRKEIRMLQNQLTEYRLQSLGTVPKKLPPGWKQGTYGGLPLYLVPCDNGQTPLQSNVSTSTK